MTPDDKNDFLDQISAANIGQLREIISRLESMPVSASVNELTDAATDNIYALAGFGGDY